MPTYNERENAGKMYQELRALGLDTDIVFLDDNSPDGTGQMLDELAKNDPRLFVIHRPGKLGIGSAHQTGIRWAYDRGYETLLTMDCDFTHAPSDLPRFLAEFEKGHDIVIGSRYLEADSLPGWNRLRKTLTAMGHLLTHHMLGMSYDATGAFRIYRLPRIPRQTFDLVSARGYAFFFESLFILHSNGLRIKELPIKLPARTYGHSKMSLKEAIRSARQVASLSFVNRINPAQFRVLAPFNEVDPTLVDPQGWDEYWKRKNKRSSLIYEVIATIYRNLIIKRWLNEAVRKNFARGSELLHAGCGSGQVDQDLQDEMNITALDISVPALQLYRRNNPKAKAIKHGSILNLPFPEETFDGVYDLGVVEHFTHEEINRILRQFHRVLKPGGKVLLFWPHKKATSVWVLGKAHYILNEVMKQNVKLHPDEISLIESRKQAAAHLAGAGFDMISYEFGAKDFFVQAIVVGQKAGEPHAEK
ncbi:MAG TPA: glycosyltransferase [Tepidisphaeraceae bacterium]|nr:glycosyltransferase [Tepidisphaeraceae bacterium]